MPMNDAIVRDPEFFYEPSTGKAIGYLNPVTGNPEDGGPLPGAFASLAALEAAKPAASNVGATAVVGEVKYESRGSSWIPVPGVAMSADNLPNIGARANTWVWRNPDTITPLKASKNIYVPVGGGYFNYFITGQNFNASGNASPAMVGRWGVARIGAAYVHGQCTKTGSWGGYGVDYLAASLGAASSTGGSTISRSVVGDAIVLQTACLTNGGYAVVSIDGDWTAANRLPTFTAADYAAGLCRASDVGKRYISTYANNTIGDYHIPLADGLSDDAHTVLIEITGTKPTASSNTQVYFGRLIGCSRSGNASNNPDGSNYVMAHIEDGWEAIYGAVQNTHVFEVEKSVAGTFDFTGGAHGYETMSSAVLLLDGVDISAMAVNTWQSGALAEYKLVSTLQVPEVSGATFCGKIQSHYFSGHGLCPMVTKTKFTFSAAKRVRANYPVMLSVSGRRFTAAGGQMENYQGRWNSAMLETTEAPASAFPNPLVTGNHIGRPARIGRMSGPHGHIAYAVALGGWADLGYLTSSTDSAFLRTVAPPSQYQKLYFAGGSQSVPVSFAIGDVISSTSGWGVVPAVS